MQDLHKKSLFTYSKKCVYLLSSAIRLLFLVPGIALTSCLESPAYTYLIINTDVYGVIWPHSRFLSSFACKTPTDVWRKKGYRFSTLFNNCELSLFYSNKTISFSLKFYRFVLTHKCNIVIKLGFTVDLNIYNIFCATK